MATTEIVLIIDDDPYLRQVLRAFLEEMDLTVLEAGDGAEGLATVQMTPPSLVLLDINMPGMTGFEACRAIRGLPLAANTPVIVMTAMEGTEAKVEAFRCGAVDYVSKPLHLEDVEVRVQTHLGIRRQAVELRESSDKLQRALFDMAAMNANLVELNTKLRHSEAVKSRFLALMRNEINNPLNSIMGLADVLAGQSVSPDKARDLAAMIKDDAFQLNGQIQNVFCAAELEAGEATPQITRVDVASVLRDVADSFGPITHSRGVALRLEAGEETAGFYTDGAKLRHILSNLMANAVECSPPEQEVKLLAHLEEGWLVLHVVDHGPGLPDPVRKAIFAPFATGWNTDRIQRGHFLGLPVVKALVDLLAGQIQVLSGPGAGTAFRIALPAAACELQAESLDGNLLVFDEPQTF